MQFKEINKDNPLILKWIVEYRCADLPYNPDIIEKAISKIVNKDDWTLFAHLFIDHGRAVCIANRPQCQNCIISELCPSKTGDT